MSEPLRLVTSTLTDREEEILKYLAEGMQVKEIASHLNISPRTVDVHKTNLMHKLDIHNRAKLVVYAIQTGILKLQGVLVTDEEMIREGSIVVLKEGTPEQKECAIEGPFTVILRVERQVVVKSKNGKILHLGTRSNALIDISLFRLV